jgi:hypothetical protein
MVFYIVDTLRENCNQEVVPEMSTFYVYVTYKID